MWRYYHSPLPHRPSKKECLVTRSLVFNLRTTDRYPSAEKNGEAPKNIINTNAFSIVLYGELRRRGQTRRYHAISMTPHSWIVMDSVFETYAANPCILPVRLSPAGPSLRVRRQNLPCHARRESSRQLYAVSRFPSLNSFCSQS